MSDFLPAGYEPAKSESKFTKFAQGTTRIRILSNSLLGFEYFNTENKPVRSENHPKQTPGIKEGGKVKEFWAFVIWNYNTESIEVCQITQAGVKSAIYSLYLDQDYGDPKSYDLKITKQGEKLETTYTVIPTPIKAIDKDIADVYATTDIYLEALFTGQDPFAGTPNLS